jgi:hypothetical protein
MVEVAESYEMVRNFNNFKVLLILVYKFWICLCSSGKFFLTMLMLVRKLPLPPPRRQHFQEKCLRLGQNPRKCWSKHDDTSPPPPPPPPPMLMASRRPWMLNDIHTIVDFSTQ